tara:strand:- start:113 stop:688 length:576 start_codon:yes stop_codon:yes gene_type:complete
MKKKIKIFFIFFFLIILTISAILYLNKRATIKKIEIPEEKLEDISSNSNILENVRYVSRDTKGNEYIITAKTGEIDYSEPNIIFLKNVDALINLTNTNTIEITSDYGKYNNSNFDTIFSKNVIVKYLDNKINGEYLDFSTTRETMIISKNVIYTNFENILKADVVEIDIETKDTKIFMYDKNEQVNIQSIE